MNTAVQIAGLVTIAVGVALISLPAGLITAGVLAVLWTIAAELNEGGE